MRIRGYLLVTACLLAAAGWLFGNAEAQSVYVGAGALPTSGGAAWQKSWGGVARSALLSIESGVGSRFSTAAEFMAAWFGEGWNQDGEMLRGWDGAKPRLTVLGAIGLIRVNTEVGAKPVVPYLEVGGGCAAAHESAYEGTTGTVAGGKSVRWPSRVKMGHCLVLGTGVRLRFWRSLVLMPSYQYWFVWLRQSNGEMGLSCMNGLWLSISFR